MEYTEEYLVLGRDYVQDNLYHITLKDLRLHHHELKVDAKDVTPILNRLMHVALHDIEANIIELEGATYFGAGKKFGASVFTRDIALAGILSLNKLYPKLMLDSMKYTRFVRQTMGFNVDPEYIIAEIDAPWLVNNENEEGSEQLLKGGPITRRTDDVVWIWCTYELVKDDPEELKWFYDLAKSYFKDVYSHFYDAADGLYRGQACFVDIHFPQFKANGYPSEWQITDCAMIKALSTNCLYKGAMDCLALAANALGLKQEEEAWQKDSSMLREAILRELTLEDGTLSYYKDPWGKVTNRRDALGTAFAVLHGIVVGEHARKVMFSYPRTTVGIPLFDPFFELDHEKYTIKPLNHNYSTWPFVDRFFIQALEAVTEEEYTSYNLAILARTCTEDGTFHELVDSRDGRVKGSKSQLWSAAAYLNICLEQSWMRLKGGDLQ